MIDQFVLKIGNINIPQKQVAQGLSMIDALDETLDTATVIIAPAKRQEVFPMWENVWLTIDGVTRTYMVSEDSVDMLSKQPVLFKHTVQLIEPTKYLDVLPCDNLTFTKPSNQLSYPDDLEGKNASLWHVLRRIRMCAQLRLENATEPFPFEIDPAVESELKSIEAPQFFLNVGNVRDAVNQVLKYINAVARCWIAEDGTLMLAYDRFNKRNNLIPDEHVDITKGYITNYGASQSIQDYASEVQTYVSNLTTDSENADQAVIVYPGKYTWASVRANDNSGFLTTDNLCFPTPTPIYNVEMLKVWMPIVRGWATLNPEFYFYEADLTKFVVEESVYKTLEAKTKWKKVSVSGGEYYDVDVLGRDTAIVYEYRGNTLYGLSDTNPVSYGYLISNRSVVDVLAAYIYGKEKKVAVYEPPKNEEVILNPGKNLTWTSDYNFSDLMYRIKYVGTIDGRYSVVKTEKTVKAMINVNQATNLTDNIALGNNLEGLVQRLGQDEKLYTVRFKKYQNVWNIGDYTSDGYIVTKRGISIYNDIVIGNMTLNKNFNRRSQFVDLDSEIRQFVIPAKENSLTRHSLVHLYAYFGTQVVASNVDSIKSYQALQASISNYYLTLPDYELGAAGISNLQKISQDNKPQKIAKGLDSKSFGNSLAFTFGFDDNRSAGNSIGENSDKKNVETAINFTEEGGISKITLELGNQVGGPGQSSFGSHSKLAKSLPLLDPALQYDLINVALEFDNLLLYKDPAETWRCTTQMHFLTNPIDEGEFIIGEGFCVNNFLVNEFKVRTLSFYSLPVGDKFQKYETKSVRGNQNSNQIGSAGVTEGSIVLSIYGWTRNLSPTQSWCIGDRDSKEMYFAYNPSMNATEQAKYICLSFSNTKK